MDDLYTRFNRKQIDDRKIDTLIGISKGVLADGKVNQAEAEFLLTWLVQSRQASDHPLICNLLTKVEDMLADEVLDPEEASELVATLRQITGEEVVVGELAPAASLPLDDPQPRLLFPAKRFVFTGTCAFGTRKQCHAAIESLGGVCAAGVNKQIDYVVIGTYVTDSWAHETFGRKIEKAMQYRDAGVPLAIVSERHWLTEAGL